MFPVRKSEIQLKETDPEDLMRESYNSFRDRIVNGYDIIFVARNTINDAGQKEVERSLFGTLRACGLIMKIKKTIKRCVQGHGNEKGKDNNSEIFNNYGQGIPAWNISVYRSTLQIYSDMQRLFY